MKLLEGQFCLYLEIRIVYLLGADYFSFDLSGPLAADCNLLHVF